VTTVKRVHSRERPDGQHEIHAAPLSFSGHLVHLQVRAGHRAGPVHPRPRRRGDPVAPARSVRRDRRPSAQPAAPRDTARPCSTA